jgi:hypothetical protein
MLKPAAAKARIVAERMKAKSVITYANGTYENVLETKPAMIASGAEAGNRGRGPPLNPSPPPAHAATPSAGPWDVQDCPTTFRRGGPAQCPTVSPRRGCGGSRR